MVARVRIQHGAKIPLSQYVVTIKFSLSQELGISLPQISKPSWDWIQELVQNNILGPEFY